MLNEAVLDQRLTALEAARNWSPRVVSRLETLIRTGPDEALLRINPVRFAAERGLAEREAVDLFLHAALVHLFEMDWALICPVCSDVVANFRSLGAVERHFHCNLCHCDFEAALDEFVAVTFTVHPEARRIRFHDPETLSVEDYTLYRFAPEGMTKDGVPWVEVVRKILRAGARLRPGEEATLAFEAAPGLLLGSDLDSDATFAFQVAGEPTSEARTLPIAILPGVCSPDRGAIAPGPVTIHLRNASQRAAAFGVLNLPPGVEHERLKFSPFLSGKQLLLAPTFRDNFRSELIRAGDGLAVRDVTLLFTDLKGSTALYQRIGDLNAYMLVQRHFERLIDVTASHNGAVNKTIGDAVMAAFPTPADAVSAALAMRSAVEELNGGRAQRDFVLKIGVHRGAAIAVTSNERLDYFGQTVNIAARVQNAAGGDEICLTEEVRQEPGVEGLLEPYAVRRAEVELKGIDQASAVYFVGGHLRADDARAAAR
jgi:class 3 adenylate cyclase